MTEPLDAIVVGLGPTGATLAALLAQRGLRVAAFDRLPDLFPLPRAAGLDHEAMRILQELGLAERVAPHIAPYRPSEYRGAQGQLIKRLDAAPPPFALGWAPNYVFEQPAVERLLRARLAELGVRAECSAQVLAVGQAGDHAWAEVQLADGRVERLQARYLVACDGGSSPIRKQLGIALEDLGFDEPWLVVDAIVDEDKLAQLPQTQVQFCEPQRPATFVVGVGRHRRWELMLNPGDSLATEFPEEQLWPLLRRWIQPGEARIWRCAAYRFHGLVAREWRRGRILLAGDAAHMTPPFLAQGMMQGLRDALNLAWKLPRVLQGASPDRLLDTYRQERHPHVVATTKTAMALGRLICERDPARAAERDARLLAEQGGEVRTQLRQNMIPKLTDGLLSAGSPGAGEILPQPLVRSGRFAGRLDDLAGRGVRLVWQGPLAPGERAALEQALVPLGGVLVHTGRDGPVVEDEDVLAGWLAGFGARAALARPDHYVFGTSASIEGAVALLHEFGQGVGAPAAR